MEFYGETDDVGMGTQQMVFVVKWSVVKWSEDVVAFCAMPHPFAKYAKDGAPGEG
jgi:hypothetical protein